MSFLGLTPQASSRPKTALFGNLGVDLRISLCGVQEYTSAQILDLLNLARKSLVFASGTAPSPPEFPDGNRLHICRAFGADIPNAAAEAGRPSLRNALRSTWRGRMVSRDIFITSAS
jgi:hypothetical protein